VVRRYHHRDIPGETEDRSAAAVARLTEKFLSFRTTGSP
jgi:hypothetical protein